MDEEQQQFDTMEVARQAMQAQLNSLEECNLCHKKYQPGVFLLRFRDSELGNVKACMDCSLIAVAHYIKILNQGG